jgi:DNA-binding response OmpR family regulator
VLKVWLIGLIVEDEFLTASFIKNVLLEQGVTKADTADNAIDAEKLFKRIKYDIVFMDINIKGPIDGIELAVKLYRKFSCKIIFITSYQDSQTIYEASFADPLGYIIKPVIPADIESIFMIAKKTFETTQDLEIVQLGKYCYNKETKALSHLKGKIKLSKLESKAFDLLVKNANNVVENDYLKNYLWGEARSNSTLRELISRLRKKVPELDIQNHSNLGYVLIHKS